jgi:hypothetical protein
MRPLPCVSAFLAVVVWGHCAVEAAAGVSVTRFQPGGRFDPGPVLMGDEVVWAEPRRGGAAVIRSARAGSREVRTLARLAAPPGSRINWVDVSASEDAWAAGFTATSYAGYGSYSTLSEVVAGEAGEAGRPLVTCRRGPGAAETSLTGTTLASRIDPCDEVATGIDVRDPFDSAVPAARLVESSAFELAGERIAGVDGNAFVVREWRTGREVLRRVAGREGYQGPFALDADGTLAYSYSTGNGARTEVVAPDGRRLLAIREGASEIRISHGRVATLRTRRVGAIRVFDLATGGRHTIARRLLTTRLDFDGDRLTWLEPACRGARVAFLSSYTDSFRSKRPTCRRLPVVGPPRLRRGRTVRLRFACSGFATVSCPSRVTVRSLRGELLGSSRSSEVPVDVYQGAARVRISRRGRELLRERERPRVIVETRLRDELGRLERRRATVALRRG